MSVVGTKKLVISNGYSLFQEMRPLFVVLRFYAILPISENPDSGRKLSRMKIVPAILPALRERETLHAKYGVDSDMVGN